MARTSPDGLSADGQRDLVLPNYDGANIRGLVPALLRPGGRSPGSAPWFPRSIDGDEQVVLLVVDGLGWMQLQDRLAVAPTLAAMNGAPITSVVPSTTATALTSITTGLTPGEHGIVGYRMDVGGGVVMNSLRWATDRGDARSTVEPRRLQPFEPFLGELVPVVSKAELEHTGFTQAHLRGASMRGWRVMSSIVPQVRALIDEGERLVYAYYDGVDRVAHERGFGPYYDAELRAVDAMVADLLGALGEGVAVVITADHGQVHVGTNTVAPHQDVLARTRYTSGEGRFRWLHGKGAHAVAGLLDAARQRHGHQAWVVTRDQVIDEGWLGRVVSGPVAQRLGDVALVARDDISFDDPSDSGPYPLVCRHGSLTAAEMYVPLLVGRGSRP